MRAAKIEKKGITPKQAGKALSRTVASKRSKAASGLMRNVSPNARRDLATALKTAKRVMDEE